MHDPRLEGMLGRLEADTRIVWGEDDRLVPPDYGERLAELIPHRFSGRRGDSRGGGAASPLSGR